jgi:hypothetical protein
VISLAALTEDRLRAQIGNEPLWKGVRIWLQDPRLELVDRRTPLAYKSGVHVVVETAPFMAAARAARLSVGEIDRIIDHLARRPDAGNVVQGTGGARKVWFAGRGKGKSGGYRVITFYSGGDLRSFC